MNKQFFNRDNTKDWELFAVNLLKTPTANSILINAIKNRLQNQLINYYLELTQSSFFIENNWKIKDLNKLGGTI